MALFALSDLPAAPRWAQRARDASFSGSNVSAINPQYSDGGAVTIVGTPTAGATINGVVSLRFDANGEAIRVAQNGITTGEIFALFVFKSRITPSTAAAQALMNILWATQGNTGNPSMVAYLASDIYRFFVTGGWDGPLPPPVNYGSGVKLNSNTPDQNLHMLAIQGGSDPRIWFDGVDITPATGPTGSGASQTWKKAGAVQNYGAQTWEFFRGQYNGGAGAETINSDTLRSLVLDYAPTASDREKIFGLASWEDAGDGSLVAAGSAWASTPPTTSSDQALTPSLAANSQSFPAATVTRGAVTLAPGLVANSPSFPAAAVAPGAVTLTPALAGNISGFYAASVSPGSVALAPGLFTGGQSFFSPTVTPAAVTLSPPLVGNASGFPSPLVSNGEVSAAPPLLANAQVFHSATVALGEVSVSPPLVANSQGFFAVSVSAGPVALAAPLVDNGATFHVPAVTPGPVVLAPPPVINVSVLYGPTAIPGAMTLTPPRVANDNVIFAAFVSGLTRPFAAQLTGGPRRAVIAGAPMIAALAGRARRFSISREL